MSRQLLTFVGQFMRARGNPLAAYAAGGIKPATVLDFENDKHLGTVSAFSDLDFAATSNATVTDSDGLLKWRAHNLLSKSEDLSVLPWTTAVSGVSAATRTPTAGTDPLGGNSATRLDYPAVSGSQFSVVQNNQGASFGPQRRAGVWLKAYSAADVGKQLCVYGQGLSGQVAHTLTSDWTLVNTGTIPSSTTPSFNISVLGSSLSGGTDQGAVSVLAWGAHAYRSDLGGMQNNPLTGDSYVPTTTAAVYMPRFDYASGARRLLIEPTAATNLLLNSGTLSTQNVTTTAQAYTLHFTGTGTVTLSGTSTAGPLVGTGTGESHRVSLTFTPTAGTLTLTVTGTVTNAQLEAGSVPTSYTPATRAAETLTVPAAKIADYTTAVGFAMSGEMTGQSVPMRWYVDANNYITQTINGDGDVVFEQAASGTVDNAESTTAYTLGVNVPFSIAGRHGSTFVQGATDGTANTANTTPTAVMDGSATDIQLAYSGGPQRIAKFIMWVDDIGESGIEEAALSGFFI